MNATVETDEIKSEIIAILNSFALAKESLEEQVRSELDSFLEEVGLLETAVSYLDGEVDKLWNTVSIAKENLAAASSDLLRDMKQTSIEKQLDSAIDGGTAAMLSMPLTGRQLVELKGQLASIPSEVPRIPSGSELKKQIDQHVSPKVTAIGANARTRLNTLKAAGMSTVKRISDVPDNILNDLAETLTEQIDELKNTVSETLESGEEICGQLEDGAGSLFDRGESAVSNIDEAWKSLAGLWEGLNDDMPEAKGTLGDVQSAVEDTKFAIDETVSMI
ncbi:MAG: hypothetical protein AAF483_13830 [Planctomycetota bacterium]